jgi:hypothetical protein
VTTVRIYRQAQGGSASDAVSGLIYLSNLPVDKATANFYFDTAGV